MPVSLVILILYIAALFGISWYAKKRSEGNNENYALAGRKLSAPLICVTIIGLDVGGRHLMRIMQRRRPTIDVKDMIAGAAERKEIYKEFRLFEAE